MPFTPIPYLNVAGVVLSTHGLMFLTAALVCLALARARLATADFRHIFNCLPVITLSSLIGARAAYVLTRPDIWSNPLSWIRFWEGGMVSYGGLAGTLAALWVCLSGRGRARIFDLLAGPCLVGWGVGRIGCFLSWYGEEGVSTQVPWGVIVSGSVRHPVTAYLAFLYIVGGVVLTSVPQGLPGRTSFVALCYFATVRGVSDFWRDYQPEYLGTLSQLTCTAMLLLSLILFHRMGRVPPTSVESEQ